MDLTKLGSSSWAEPGASKPSGPKVVSKFQNETKDEKYFKEVADILDLTRTKFERQHLGEKKLLGGTTINSASTPLLRPIISTSNPENKSKKLNLSSSTKKLSGVSYSIQERPPNRLEISVLESKLDDCVQTVLSLDDDKNPGTLNLYQPYKEEIMITKARIMQEFEIDTSQLSVDPWLERLIKCEGLRSICDDVSSQLVDMLCVSSIEYGNVLRKLRFTYRQSFDEMRQSWKELRRSYLKMEREQREDLSEMRRLRAQLEGFEDSMRQRHEKELLEMKTDYLEERRRDKEVLAQSEQKMAQMGETLRSLNGLFKAMQTDSASASMSDLSSRCKRLERENSELAINSAAADKLRHEMTAAQARAESLDRDLRAQMEENKRLHGLLVRRDDMISSLMEKEAMHNAEMEKLMKMAPVKDPKHKDPNEEADLGELTTSVLCIKCKKSLDDLSLIRDVVLGGNKSRKEDPLQCQSFRILLPNLKGRRPNKPTMWLKTCMRALLFSKLNEDVNLQSIQGEITPFPQYAYAWFERSIEDIVASTGGSGGTAAINKAMLAADEERWAFYYGLKTLCRENDAEAMVIWSLLCEAQGEDGLQFVCHCLSTVMSLGGVELWEQFGATVHQSVEGKGNGCVSACMRQHSLTNDAKNFKNNVWLDKHSAKHATRLILGRAMQGHISDALEAIDALTVIPDVEGPVDEDKAKEATAKSSTDLSFPPSPVPQESSHALTTHINIFLWLRLMLQQLQAEQIHRTAAIRLMFETSSIGASLPGTSAGRPQYTGATNSEDFQVDFPQFLSICRTLFPSLPTAEIALLFVICFENGKGNKVTADVFLREIQRKGLLARHLRFNSLPLLKKHNPIEIEKQQLALATKQQQEAGDLLGMHISLSAAPPSENELSQMRIKLGALVHIKMTQIIPEIKKMMEGLPERWRLLLKESISLATQSLEQTYIKKKRFGESHGSGYEAGNSLSGGGSVGGGSVGSPDSSTVDGSTLPGERMGGVSEHPQHIDGIQPFIYYRRLLSLALLVKSLTDNPVLPIELFHDKSTKIIPSNGSDSSYRLCEQLLTHLEMGFLAAGKGSDMQNSTFVRFQQTRKMLMVIKVQAAYKAFISLDFSVPRALRMAMRRGYLRGDKDVRTREIVYEPWWAQTAIAEVYHFKLIYDQKAVKTGLAPLSLAQAVVAQHYFKWGNADVAERFVHDLCVSSKEYSVGLPRLRLFLAFIADSGKTLGEDLDVDEVASDALRTPYAVQAYLNLILEIHNEIALNKAQVESAKASGTSQPNQVSRLSSFTTGGSPEPTTPEEEIAYFATEDFPRLVIPTLFPTSQSFTARGDRRAAWTASAKVLGEAGRKWGLRFDGTNSSPSLYSDLAMKIRRNPVSGEADVDEYLWVAMIQWAKVASWFIRKSVLRSHWSDMNAPGANPDTMPSSMIALRGPGGAKLGSGKNTNNFFPLTYLEELVQFVYKKEKGEPALQTDHQYHTALYASMHFTGSDFSSPFSLLHPKRFLHVPKDKDSSSTADYLRSCVMWDINTPTLALSACSLNPSTFHSAMSAPPTASASTKSTSLPPATSSSTTQLSAPQLQQVDILSAVSEKTLLASVLRAVENYKRSIPTYLQEVEHVVNQYDTNMSAQESFVARTLKRAQKLAQELTPPSSSEDLSLVGLVGVGVASVGFEASTTVLGGDAIRRGGQACCEVFRVLVSLIDTLAINTRVGFPVTGYVFPRDAWQGGGRRSHVDRSSAYAVAIKSNFSG